MSKFGTSLALAALLSFPAAAQPSAKVADIGPQGGSLSLAYSIAFWGIPFGQTNYDGRFTDTGYSARSHFQTSGIVSMFWQATIDATANGHISQHALLPSEYDSYYRRSEDKKERVKVTFAGGDATTFADPPYNMTQYPVTAEQKREAVDPMSAVTLILSGVKADASNPCGTVAPVYDGRRRYDITFSYVKDEQVKLANGLFNGKAHLCQLHYNQIAGFKPKIMKEGKAFPPMFADFADVGSGGPNGHYVVALKLWSPMSWGTVSADLIQLHVGGDNSKS
ncbi:MAG: DUF3108 domain-containing protein [Rhizomicrobium sp.]|jgi:hypothetical protein